MGNVSFGKHTAEMRSDQSHVNLRVAPDNGSDNLGEIGVVSRLGFEPRTPALKGQCSTIELPARLSITIGQLLRSLPGQRVSLAAGRPCEVYPYKITSLDPFS